MKRVCFLGDSMHLDSGFIHAVLPNTHIEGEWPNDAEFFIDSRKVKPGGIFIALPGNKVDGHDFIEAALQQGARALVIEKNKSHLLNTLSLQVRRQLAILFVDCTKQALIELARTWRQQFSIPIIGITGSINKTTTKETVGHLLTRAGKKILLTQGNENTILSLSTCLLKLRPSHDCAVMEMGIQKTGEMVELARLVKPTIAIITYISHSHVEGIGALTDIFAEKRAIFSFFSEKNIGIINGDIQLLNQASYPHPVIKFGLKMCNQIQARKIKLHGLVTDCTIKLYGERHPIKLPYNHPSRLYATLAALAVGHLLGIEKKMMFQAIQEPIHVGGRFEPKRIKENTGWLISDCYNASLESMRAALKSFDAIETDLPKIAILGDMRELGFLTIPAHRQIGKILQKTESIREVILIGEHMKEALKTVPSSINYMHVQTWQQALPLVRKKIETTPACLLFKGSRSMQLDNIVKEIAVSDVHVPHLSQLIEQEASDATR
jgi:UDP-N-acetylmuramoyl-tripeptide--D-alanyl-D-alanine ligase